MTRALTPRDLIRSSLRMARIHLERVRDWLEIIEPESVPDDDEWVDIASDVVILAQAFEGEMAALRAGHQGASAGVEPGPADCVLSTDDGGRVPLSDFSRETR